MNTSAFAVSVPSASAPGTQPIDLNGVGRRRSSWDGSHEHPVPMRRPSDMDAHASSSVQKWQAIVSLRQAATANSHNMEAAQQTGHGRLQAEHGLFPVIRNRGA